MPHICRIFRQNAAYFTAFLAGELPAYFPKKSRYKPVSLTGSVSYGALLLTILRITSHTKSFSAISVTTIRCFCCCLYLYGPCY